MVKKLIKEKLSKRRNKNMLNYPSLRGNSFSSFFSANCSPISFVVQKLHDKSPKFFNPRREIEKNSSLRRYFERDHVKNFRNSDITAVQRSLANLRTPGRCKVVVECVRELLLPFYLFVRAWVAG